MTDFDRMPIWQFRETLMQNAQWQAERAKNARSAGYPEQERKHTQTMTELCAFADVRDIPDATQMDALDDLWAALHKHCRDAHAQYGDALQHRHETRIWMRRYERAHDLLRALVSAGWYWGSVMTKTKRDGINYADQIAAAWGTPFTVSAAA